MSKRPPVASRPSASDRALERATLALQMQRPDEAEWIAADVLKANRGNIVAATILGRALLMQNRAGEAIAPLERAARRGGDPAVETLLAAALAAAGRRDEALDQLRQTTARRPAFAPAFLEHAGQLANIGKIDEAIAVFESGLALAPDAIDLQKQLGLLLLKCNDRARARALFLQALAMAPGRSDVLAGLAQVMLLDGEYADAAETYRRVVALRPDDAIARADLGRCLLEMGERDAGEASIRTAAGGRPQMLGRAIVSLAASSHGRFFLRRSAATKFLRGS
jgi:tetratricopeptide (TPR) repeat protein